MIELSSENLQSMSTAETEAKREINVKEIQMILYCFFISYPFLNILYNKENSIEMDSFYIECINHYCEVF